MTGPESSGKSTLSSELSQSLGIPFIVEHARTYLTHNGPLYSYQDLLIIAQEHYNIVEALLPKKYILDTYLLNIKIWSEYKYGRVDSWIVEQLHEISFKHIFLLEPDIEWTYDPLRENPDNRYELFDIYKKELELLGWSFDILSGTKSERLNKAIAIIHK